MSTRGKQKEELDLISSELMVILNERCPLLPTTTTTTTTPPSSPPQLPALRGDTADLMFNPKQQPPLSKSNLISLEPAESSLSCTSTCLPDVKENGGWRQALEKHIEEQNNTITFLKNQMKERQNQQEEDKRKQIEDYRRQIQAQERQIEILLEDHRKQSEDQRIQIQAQERQIEDQRRLIEEQRRQVDDLRRFIVVLERQTK